MGSYISGAKSRVTIIIIHIRGHITPLKTTYYPGHQNSPRALHTPPGQKFRHAAYNIDVCRGEAESPKTRFYVASVAE